MSHFANASLYNYMYNKKRGERTLGRERVDAARHKHRKRQEHLSRGHPDLKEGGGGIVEKHQSIILAHISIKFYTYASETHSESIIYL
jgi:hypothetical protein